MAKETKIKDQYYKLGEKASSFVDPISGVKILRGQVVKVEGLATKSGKLKLASTGGHIIRVDQDDYDEYVADQKAIASGKAVAKSADEVQADEFADDSAELKEFRKLSDAKKRKALKDDYELDEDEIARLDEAKGEEIISIYRELLAADEEESTTL